MGIRRRRSYRRNSRRRIRVVGVQRDKPDVHRMSRALLARIREMQTAQAEADAKAVDGSGPEPTPKVPEESS